MESTSLNLNIQELKTFLPAKDFESSLTFYNDIGFSTVWNNNGLALLDKDGFKFLLQRFYVKDHSENFVMHLLVDSADDWWRNLDQITSSKHYHINLTKPEDRAWGIRDFAFSDPSGVLWRVGNAL